MTGKKATKGKVTPAGAGVEIGSDLTEDGQLPLFFPALVIEGMSTSDGRNIGAGALDHRALPISVLAQWTNPGQQGGHAGAEVIGHLTELTRVPGPEVTSRQTGKPFPEGTFVWQGRGVADPDTTGGKLARQGHLRGNSVDLSDVDYDEDFADDGKSLVSITRATIAATTLCPIPAFADAYVEIGTEPEIPEPRTEDDALDALRELLAGEGYEVITSALVASLPPFRAVELGDDCGPCLAEQVDAATEWTEVTRADGVIEFSPSAAKRKRAYARGLAMKGSKTDGSDASYPIENQSDLDKAAHMVGLGNASNPAIVAHIKKAARKLGLKLPDSLAAAGAPSLPPVALFADPHLAGPSPISIGTPREDGRREITGHIATWSECHASYGNRCVRPPHSRTDYARFATGAVRALDADGTMRTVAVGRIAMSRDPQQGGHAGERLSEADTVAFYDNNCMAVADVAAGEDAHGIWVHGLTRELTEAEVDRLLSSPPSGDWRGYQGNLELCAVLAVNTPGYVVARSRVASGEPVSLVAAGRLRAGAEFAPAVGVTLDTILTAFNKALLAFFDPDNDGDIDRPLDTGTPAADTDTGSPNGMAARRDAALLALRRGAALGGVTPLPPAR